MSETQRETEVEIERKGERGGKRIMHGVCHLHTLDIRIQDKRRRCVLKVKNKMNAFIASPIVCGQSCVI